jgi:hypothetical protein
VPVFEATLLPDQIKEDLCRNLLTEFGATHVIARQDELIHGCLLPFSKHSNQGHDPTASLNWQKLTYKCLGCGSGGGLLWFIAACRPGTTATAARKWLQEQTGVDGGSMSLANLLAFFDALYSDKRQRYEPIPTYSTRILDQWDWRHPYMTEIRGVPEATLDKFRVGYAAKYQVGVNPPVFSERITIPHFWKGDLVGWQTRRLGVDGTAKYLSSPSFPREQTLYNYDPTCERAVIVESPFSVLRHDHHQHMTATFGASVTERQIRLLQKHRSVVLWMDNDEAGWNALEDTIGYKGRVDKVGMINALASHTKVYVVDSPWAADPADMDDQTVDDLIDAAVPWPLWSRPTATLKEWQEVSA